MTATITRLAPATPVTVTVDAERLKVLEAVAEAAGRLIYGPCGWEYAQAYNELRDTLLPRLDGTPGGGAAA